MAINGAAVRDTYESLGPVRFVHHTREMLGLENPATGGRYYNLRTDLPCLGPQTIRPESVSIRDLAESLFGSSEQEIRRGLAGVGGHVDLIEAGGTSEVPSQFANISAFNSTVAGLLEAKILEVWNRPAYIGDQLTKTVPSKKRSEKFIGISTMGDEALERKPAQPHARAHLSERYVTTPDTTNYGMAIEVTREAVMFDLTTQLLSQAERITEVLATRKEYRIIDCVLGITNTYTYNGTAYSTYVASGGNWVNIVASNPLADWTDVDNALFLFSTMTDQEKSEPIDIAGFQVLVMPAKQMTANYLFNSTGLEFGAVATGTHVGTNPLRQFPFQLLPVSPRVYARAIATDGLALSAANAKGLWYIGDFPKAFCYVENLPLHVERAVPGSFAMADNGLVLAVFVDEMGTPGVLEPRYVVKCKNEA